MRLAPLLTRLPEGSVSNLSLADPEADVYTLGFLTPQGTTIREDVLYFGDATLLERATIPESPNLVLYGSGQPEIGALPPASNIVELSPESEPFSCYNALQACFLEDQEQAAIIRRMLAAHFSNAGLQYLIEEAAMALGNPLVVVDTTYRYIAHHLADLEGVDSTLARVMDEEIRNETVLDNAVSYIQEQHIDSKIAEMGGLLIRHNDILDCNTMTGAVMVRGVCIAHVMMMEHARKFTDLDRECFFRLLSFVAQEMQKNEVWGPTSGEMGSFFLANLLSDHQPSEAVTRRRLRSLNFHPKAVFHVVCLHAPGEGLRQDQVELLAGQLRPMLHHSLYTRYHQNLVILTSRDNASDLEHDAFRLLGEVATLNGLSVGVSNAFDRMIETRVAYDQARSAVRMGDTASHIRCKNRLYRYCDYAYLHLLEQEGRHTNLLRYCHPALSRLAAHDEQHGGELMETLFCYLQVSGITKRAAELLNLHKNTLLYRMNRIKEVLGMDLTSGEDQFVLQLSFRVLMYLGLFTPRIAVNREKLNS
ncbi:MAG: helix-turn-helix domain-containing protein [Atopobiaceae bacterium]|nr:helix-turn-helix domain-containing protein [Atopobiaceae bacterium]